MTELLSENGPSSNILEKSAKWDTFQEQLSTGLSTLKGSYFQENKGNSNHAQEPLNHPRQELSSTQASMDHQWQDFLELLGSKDS
ncbi:hypothetical protein A2U01_0036429 [Trifolium medium]|uniref:Uncharacterized protein n=1 Tax=Trifolium medium TaxID=97028 RepID=A0A392PT70_9FABA|nr:hypothetical protein [Trifolium medium]